MDERFFERLLATFRIEAEEHLRNIANGMVAYEQAPAEGEDRLRLIEDIYREAHSLKGAARAVSLFDIQTVCQNLETVLSGLKAGEVKVTPEIIDACLSAVDCIRNYLERGQGEGKNAAIRECIEVADRLALLGEQNKSSSESAPVIQQGLRTKRTQRSAAPSQTEQKNSAPLTVKQIPPSSLSVGPTAAEATPQNKESELKTSDKEMSPAEVSAKDSSLKDASSKDVHNKEVALPQRQDQAAQEIIRVPVARLDAIMALSEEFLPLRLQNQQIADAQKLMLEQLKKMKREWNIFETELFSSAAGIDRGKADDIISSFRNYFSSAESALRANLSLAQLATRSLSGRVTSLIDDVKGMLMLPFKEMTDIFPKMCRDIARELGKEVELRITGGDVVADRRILEELKDPIIHLLRNAIDHGIETPEERIKKGKSAKGTVVLSIAQVSGNTIELSLIDDGKGIDSEVLVSKAIEKGMLTRENALQLSEKDKLGLIFNSGLSTSAMITDLSGRGLGMAIVKEKIRKLDGDIFVDSVPGTGSVFRLYLPPSKAGVRGMLLEVSDMQFVLPTAKVEQTLRLPASDITKTGGTETIFYRNTTVRLTHLASLLGLRRKNEFESHYIIVILAGNEGKAALIIDKVVDEREVVVKPFKKPIIRLPNMAGITIAGDGKIIPVLSGPDILIKALRGEGSGTVAPERKKQARKTRILVADDSITSRMLIKDILESAGYEVKAYVDGMEALTAVKSEPFDLVVSDVEMPRMNGFELTASIRKSDAVAKLPVILVTALARREDKERGVDAGANAYIVKGSFDQNNLLETIERLL